jgi:uncharacterized protein (TIGR03000 family)
MVRRWFLRGAPALAAACALLTPATAPAQFVVIRPGWGGLGGSWGRPFSPVSPLYNPAGWGGFGAFGGYGYGNYLFPSYFPSAYTTNPFVTGAYAFPGLYNYGFGEYSGYAVNTPVPGWAVGPATGCGGVGYAGPRMRPTTADYTALPLVTGGQFVGPVAVARPAESAVIDVTLPDPAAEVWVEGARTRQGGTQRRYLSPELAPGSDYVYAIRARWRDAQGTVKLQQQNVVVRAGARVSVTFPSGP